MYICIDVITTTQNAVLISLNKQTVSFFWLTIDAISEVPELCRLKDIEKEPNYLGDFSSKGDVGRCMLDADSSKTSKSRTVLKLNSYGIQLIKQRLEDNRSLVDDLYSKL